MISLVSSSIGDGGVSGQGGSGVGGGKEPGSVAGTAQRVRRVVSSLQVRELDATGSASHVHKQNIGVLPRIRRHDFLGDEPTLNKVQLAKIATVLSP